MKKLKVMLIILNSSFLILGIHPFGANCFSQWIQQSVPVNKPITGIEFVDTFRGWACTSRGAPADTGYILYTTNGGTNWLVQLSVYNIPFTDIDMINALTGYVAGDDFNIGSIFKLFKTTNGGINWTYTTMMPNMYIGDMQFLNKDSAWECGFAIGVADVRTTTDGGNSWIIRNNGINQTDAQRVFFLNYDTGFCAAGYLFKTTNAGLNWGINGVFGEGVESIFFLNLNTGWLGLTGGKIASTSNGGVNWNVQQPFWLNSNNTTDMYFLNNSTGYAGTGWYQKILKTTNGGINWGYQVVPTGSVRLSIINTLIGWCADLGISKTANGGGNITFDGIKQISSNIPEDYKLFQNFPNPFNSGTNIEFDIVKHSHVKLLVYNVLGKEIAILINTDLKSGRYKVDWSANDFSSGLYFYKLIVDENVVNTKKMILVR